MISRDSDSKPETKNPIRQLGTVANHSSDGVSLTTTEPPPPNHVMNAIQCAVPCMNGHAGRHRWWPRVARSASCSGDVIGGLFFAHPEVGVFTERAERIVVGVAAHGLDGRVEAETVAPRAGDRLHVAPRAALDRAPAGPIAEAEHPVVGEELDQEAGGEAPQLPRVGGPHGGGLGNDRLNGGTGHDVVHGNEGLPRSILEAMAAGRAVVASDIAGVREQLEPGVTGLRVLTAKESDAGVLGGIKEEERSGFRPDGSGQPPQRGSGGRRARRTGVVRRGRR